MVDVSIITEGISNFNQIGGVSTWLRDLINGLSHINFSVINFYFDEDFSSESLDNNLPNLKSYKNIFLKEYPLSIDKMREVFGNLTFEDSKIYYATSTGCSSLCGMFLSDLNNKPFILTEHAIYWQEAKEANELECGLRIGQKITNELRNIAKMAYKKASIVTTPTNYTRNIEISEGAEPLKCKVIFNGIDPDKFEFRLRFPVENIGFVGRITKIKNIERILRIWKILSDKNSSLRFFIIGPITDQNYYKYLKEITSYLGLNKKVEFTGPKARNEWVNYIDAIFLASKMETQPYVVLEALASGILPIVPNVGGLPETVFDAGVIFDTNSMDKEIALKIEKIIFDKEYVTKRNFIAKKLIDETYSLDKMLNSYSDIFRLFF